MSQNRDMGNPAFLTVRPGPPAVGDMPMLSRRSFSLWVALSASVVSQIFAQTAASPDSESSVATFHVNARSVVVDVVVTDKSGKAVTGIPRQNFQVFEDGKPQPITF